MVYSTQVDTYAQLMVIH